MLRNVTSACVYSFSNSHEVCGFYNCTWIIFIFTQLRPFFQQDQHTWRQLKLTSSITNSLNWPKMVWFVVDLHNIRDKWSNTFCNLITAAVSLSKSWLYSNFYSVDRLDFLLFAYDSACLNTPYQFKFPFKVTWCRSSLNFSLET